MATQLAVDAWRAPGGLRRHATDEAEHVEWQGRVPRAAAVAGDPGPVRPEACAVPADDGPGVDDGGLAALAASTTFGVAWDPYGSAVAVAASGVLALAAAVTRVACAPGRPEEGA